jgi:tetratricopeptide (TPR) repeat protein
MTDEQAAQPTAASFGELGNAHAELGQWPEAIAAYDRGLSLNPDDPQLHFKR